MKPRAEQLAMRDPALAALMGAIGTPDFGYETEPESLVDRYDLDPQFGSDYGVDFGGVDFGVDFGTDGDELYPGADAPLAVAPAAIVAAGARHPMHPLHPMNHAKMVDIWAKHHAKTAHTNRRAMLLEPNRGSDVKIERYTLWLSTNLVLATPSAINMTSQPDFNIRPQRVTMNAPSPGFVTVSEIKVANVSVTSGGTGDAFEFNALGVGQTLDMPTLSPANKATVLGNYTGFVPPGFVGGATFLFSASLKGPATIVA